MCFRRVLYSTAAAIAIETFAVGYPAAVNAQQAAEVAIDQDDIGGVVTGPNGPEAGVWVIADLPTANYSVWARGYGLVDSPKVRAKPGQHLDLAAAPTPNPEAAAHYYPAIYWYSMLKIPPASEFGGKGEVPEKITLSEYLTVMKNRACVGCHQLGQESTRTIPAQFGEFPSGADAWARRVQSGQAAPLMVNPLAGQLGGVPFKYLGDWTDRIARGDLPKNKTTTAARA